MNDLESKKPTIFDSTHKNFKDYPNPSKPYYLVFNLVEKEMEFLNNNYNCKELKGFSKDKQSFPHTCKLSELIVNRI